MRSKRENIGFVIYEFSTCIDRDTVWVVGLDGSKKIKESCVRRGSTGAKGRCHGNQFWDYNCYN